MGQGIEEELFLRDAVNFRFQCWAVNCKANLHIIRKALPTFNANAEGGVFLLTSSVAGVSASGSSMAYSVSKAAGLDSIRHPGSRTC